MSSTPPSGCRRSRAGFLLLALLLLSAPLGAAEVSSRPPEPTPGELGLLAFTLEHQRAADALELIQPLLSVHGTVELQGGTNTLIVRDSLSELTRVRAALRGFDHPSRAISLDVQIVRAEQGGISPLPPDGGLDPALRGKLETLFRYQAYRLLARARIDSHEGEEVRYEMAGGFRLGFKVGTVVGGRRIRLHTLRLARVAADDSERELIHTRLNLWLDQPLVLGLARDEASPSALFLVIAFNPTGEAH